MSERFLKWAVKRHYKALGYEISMRRIRLGNTEVDGEAIGPQGEKIAIEIKTPRDDLARGLGQLAEALAFDYYKATLVTTLRNAKNMHDRVFKKFDFLLIGIDSAGKVHIIADSENCVRT